jgi:hypothetical protein
MALYDRLLGFEEPGIPVHTFMAAMSEVERGLMTGAQLATAFALTAGEQTEATTLIAKVLATPEAYAMGAFVTLTNVGTAYDTIAAAKGLGFVAVDTMGVTRLEARIRYNKVGSGTLSWQVWNETDASEIGAFDDTAGAGDNKTATIIVLPGTPLSGGVKLVRVRVKSTVATDDPVYYGACLFVRRVGLITSEALHEVLLLGEGRVSGYETVALVKTRLGV